MARKPKAATRRVWVGQPYPLGATYDGTGTNFSLYSSVAEGVELCLFGEATGSDAVGPRRSGSEHPVRHAGASRRFGGRIRRGAASFWSEHPVRHAGASRRFGGRIRRGAASFWSEHPVRHAGASRRFGGRIR